MRMMTVTAAFGAAFLLFSQSAHARTEHQHRRVAYNVTHFNAGSHAYALAYASNATSRASVYASKAELAPLPRGYGTHCGSSRPPNLLA
jgi:hypothetical protein